MIIAFHFYVRNLLYSDLVVIGFKLYYRGIEDASGTVPVVPFTTYFLALAMWIDLDNGNAQMHRVASALVNCDRAFVIQAL